MFFTVHVKTLYNKHFLQVPTSEDKIIEKNKKRNINAASNPPREPPQFTAHTIGRWLKERWRAAFFAWRNEKPSSPMHVIEIELIHVLHAIHAKNYVNLC